MLITAMAANEMWQKSVVLIVTPWFFFSFMISHLVVSAASSESLSRKHLYYSPVKRFPLLHFWGLVPMPCRASNGYYTSHFPILSITSWLNVRLVSGIVLEQLFLNSLTDNKKCDSNPRTWCKRIRVIWTQNNPGSKQGFLCTVLQNIKSST